MFSLYLIIRIRRAPRPEFPTKHNKPSLGPQTKSVGPHFARLQSPISVMSFASLPYELRSHIWSLAVEPRRITEVHREKSDGKFKIKQRRRGMDILYETTSTPPPAVMQVCREARQHAPYQRCFTAGTEARWTWVNFGVDIFCVRSVFFIEDIVEHRSDVQRLEIRTDEDWDWYEGVIYHRALDILSDFTGLRKIKIILEPGDLARWNHAAGWLDHGHCPMENITFVDERSGLALTKSQLGLVAAWRMLLPFERPKNPPDPDRLSEEIADTHGGRRGMSMAQMYEID